MSVHNRHAYSVVKAKKKCWGVSIPSSTTDLGQSKLDTPDLTLVAQAIFADNLQFRITVDKPKTLGKRGLSQT